MHPETRRGAALLLILVLCFAPAPAYAQSSSQQAIHATRDRASLQYPDSVTFSIRLQSTAEITRVVLVYGIQKLSCGLIGDTKVISIPSAKTVNASYKWDIAIAFLGAPPPGARIHWHWQVTDAAGGTLTTDEQTVSWLDTTHTWKTIHNESIDLYWYYGSQGFAQVLSSSAVRVLHTLVQDIGFDFDETINIYVYDDGTAMNAADPNLPDWAGGVAYPNYNLILFVDVPGETEWGQMVEAHEITHVLVEHFTFNCKKRVSIPVWLSEGLAEYNEGEQIEDPFDTLPRAIINNTLLPVHSLETSLPDDTDQVNLAYAESYSLVKFLIETYGHDKILALFKALRDGATGDNALKVIYDFDTFGLEDAWRESIGAQPRYFTSTPMNTPTVTLTPTPTQTDTPTQTATHTPTPTPTATSTSTTTPTPTLTASPTVTASPTPAATPRPARIPVTGLAALGGSLICLALLGGAAVFVILRRRAAAGILLALSLLALAFPSSGRAQADITAANDQAAIQFPNTITFSVDLQSDAEIQKVSLEYRVEQVTCGQVVAIAFPQFTPGKQASATWTWEMKQSGSLPPGAKIHWLWQVTDAAGNTLTTPQQSITWLDNTHAWQTLSGTNVNVHWYNSPNTFGQELLDAALTALTHLDQTTGLKPEKPIDVYIYASTDDLRQAILYEPSWIGGQAYPENDIVIIGIPPAQIDWGKGAIAHELTHVLVGHLTFTCLGYLPGWLNEGLAMYGQGGPDSTSQTRFDQAVKDNTLISVQALSGGFSENSDKADLSYSESYSLVNFLVEVYGKDKMLALLKALQEGATVDGALESVYGFDINGLEDAWRAKIGAQARQASSQTGAATATPTTVPTIVPVSAAAAGPTIAPTRVRTSPQAPPPTGTLIPSPTLQASATQAASTQALRPILTETQTPKGSSPTVLSDAIRILTSAGSACLILGGVAVVFFFTVIRPPHRRRKP